MTSSSTDEAHKDIQNVVMDDVGRQLNTNVDESSTLQVSSSTRNYVSTPGSWSRCKPLNMSPSVRVAVASSMAAVGGVMFGYDTGNFGVIGVEWNAGSNAERQV